MRKKILLPLILCNLVTVIHADQLSQQLQQQNLSTIRNENNLWQRMRDGFALSHKETKEVKYWENRYKSPKYFNIIMQNAAPYLYFVVTEMERRGIPTELALIPIVESTYNPNAVSPAAVSTGMWQFLNGSGKRFGMTINSDIDERKDIIKSTRGAISYLQYLHDLFGSWELAIAAYNWGEGNINNALNASSSKNFYDLDVRDVTHQYVPKVIALANIIENPSKFGIKLINLPNQPYFAAITPTSPITVANFMTQSNLSAALNKKLNPQYNSLNYTVNTSQKLLLPITNQSQYSPANTAPTPIASAPIIASSPIIKNPPASQSDSSDPIAAIIQAKANAINTTSTFSQPTVTTTPNQIAIAADLLGVKVAATIGNKDNTANNFTNYTVVQGDTLYSISKKFSIPASTIISDNQLSDSSVQLNQQLKIRTNS